MIQAIYHPKTAFAVSLIAFALYCWTIDYIGYRFIRRKSEALQRAMDEKGTNVPITHKHASERLYGGQERNE